MSKLVIIPIFVGFILAIIISGCDSKWGAPFPDAEIVFQEYSIDHPSLGFVNSDGSSYRFIQTGTYMIKPWWSSDGKTIYGLAWRGSVLDGYLSYWEEGRRPKTCKEIWDTEAIGGIFETRDSLLALISVRDQILFVDLKRCEEQKSLVDVVNTGIFIVGVSLSPDQKWLAYGEEKYSYSDMPEYSIMVQEISKGETTRIGSGINPAWSPDGKQISYIQLDGIYVMNADGSNSHQLNKWDMSSGDNHSKFRLDAPYPRWSPDGKWLIFHRCPPGCHGINNFTIVKVEVETGKEEIVFHGGAYPFWR